MATFTHGIVRTISRSLAHCELTHLPRQSFALPLAAQQHQSYVDALLSTGVRITVLPEEPTLPDAVFVEDTAVILDELAVLCRPGCVSREPEIQALLPTLGGFRNLMRIQPPGTLDGGDVLAIDKTLFVGLSGRTNGEGLRQLETITSRFGYRVVPVTIRGCLHLKTAVTCVAPGLLLANRAWVDLAPFVGFELLTTPKDEPWSANALRVNEAVLTLASSPRTTELLQNKHLNVRPIDISELQKAEAGLTCLSLLYRQPG
jgi:dimethylargininase